jgi:hypothetical protein
MIDYTGIELQRWEKGIDHDPRSVEIGKAIETIDWEVHNDSLCWKFGGDGDNGESLLFALDIYFELKDRGRI